MGLSLLNCIPPEIITDIFSYACAGNSLKMSIQMGPVLSLVCRTFYEHCRATGTDIQFASVRGVGRMQIFLDLLKSREQYGRRVTSLMLSEGTFHGPEHSAATVGLVIDIVRSVCPRHLRILAIYLPVPFTGISPPLSLPVVLPSLDVLLLSGTLLHSEPGQPPCTPKLTHLHLTRIVSLPSEHLTHELKSFAPMLETLKLSFAPDMDNGLKLLQPLLSFVDSIKNPRGPLHQQQQQLLTPPPSPPLPPHASLPYVAHPFPPTLRQIIVDFYPCYFARDLPALALAAGGNDPITNYRSGLLLFNRVSELPASIFGIRSNDPVVTLPVPEVRSLDEFNADEGVRLRGFTAQWEDCTMMGGARQTGRVTGCGPSLPSWVWIRT
ncbi:hypothetical protein BXZ70DRAFT_957106 [Cristinia sonorae]|uniref:F-box domain-containing protein n=1 Tax=Cristinia sonorae TaxID=1940300 RepID=A0A8K0UFG7_9AGAR|nr:hypothetical protein BXZ70DRAFT_957106 [Cristinia sonorae]